jgi:Na+-translocating ferredoxin:NAD+ oxidoreductase RNF subunit RnfB
VSREQHSVKLVQDLCDGCMSCLRACPTAAIRVRRGRALLYEDRCIDCGECIKICSDRAVVPLVDSIAELGRFDLNVAIPSPALYAQFDPELPLDVIHAGLRRCGFDAVESLSPACDAVTAATELFLAEHRGPRPVISSFCPTVVRLVQVKYPDLLEQLLPIVAPREVSARQAKERLARERGIAAERIGATYITPCAAKMVSIAGHAGGSRLDCAVSVSDVYPLLASLIPRVQLEGGELLAAETPTGLGWAFLGGFPRSLPAEYSLSVAGVANVIRILDDIEKGQLRRYAFVECHACPEGCVSGCLTVENPYVARAKIIHRMQLLELAPPPDRAAALARYREGYFDQRTLPEPLPLRPLDEAMPRAIAKMKEKEQLATTLPGIDCGACGAPSCQAFAEDVVRGAAETSACVFLWQEEVRERVEELGSLLRRWSGNKGGQP